MLRVLVLSILVLGVRATAFAGEPAFLWGVSTSAFQVEGSPGDSDWWRWLREHGTASNVEAVRRGTGFLDRYDEDFRLAQGIGLNAFRISVAWDRIEPGDGVWDDAALAHYEAMAQALRARGMTPIVTLHHFTLPAWLADRGGILSPDFPDRFARYAERVVKRLGNAPASVTLWLTFNEPMVLVDEAYLHAKWPPLLQDPEKGLQAAASFARAHLEAVRKIRRLGLPEARVSIAHDWSILEAGSDDPETVLSVKHSDEFSNHQMIRALMTGDGDFTLDGNRHVTFKVELPEGRSSLDFLGINTYGREIIRLLPDPPYWELVPGPGPKNDLGQEIYPEGVYRAIVAASRYGVPLLLTETGLPDEKDRLRSRFLDDTVAALMRARKEGHRVFGYLHWSLTDNIEWDAGTGPRFGLVAIEYDTLKRAPRPSYFHFGEVIRRASSPR